MQLCHASISSNTALWWCLICLDKEGERTTRPRNEPRRPERGTTFIFCGCVGWEVYSRLFELLKLENMQTTGQNERDSDVRTWRGRAGFVFVTLWYLSRGTSAVKPQHEQIIRHITRTGWHHRSSVVANDCESPRQPRFIQKHLGCHSFKEEDRKCLLEVLIRWYF